MNRLKVGPISQLLRQLNCKINLNNNQQLKYFSISSVKLIVNKIETKSKLNLIK